MFLQISSLVVELSKLRQTLLKTKQLHAFIIKTHLSNDPFYATRIVRFYSLNSDLCSARKVFDESPHRSVFLWNSIIRAHAQAQEFRDALSLFKKMLGTDISPDNFTYSCVIRACSDKFDLCGLRLVHGGLVVSGLGLDYFISSALVMAYSKLGLVDEAIKVFYGIRAPDLVLWNSIISGCGCCGFWDKGLSLFNSMRGTGMWPDGYTMAGLISGLVGSTSGLLGIGEGLHGLCLKSNFNSNAHVSSALVSMYSRCKCMSSASKVFDGLFQPDLVTWSSLITGYAQSGDYGRALLFFKKLNVEGKKADPILIASVLAATAQLANIGSGLEIHGYILRHGLESKVIVSSALIDMYFKCGFLRLGLRVFHIMPKRNIVSYNLVISGLGLNGLATEAFQIFEELLKEGFRPDESTFSALLCACCHSGLVEDGWEVFRRMESEFQVQARNEHYVYMVKLFGMNGELEKAYKLILSLPEPVDTGIWGALLSSCDVHGNTELAEIIAQRIFENEPKTGVYKVMLSNMYAGYGRWDIAKNFRDDMIDRKQQKTPGLSLLGGGRNYGYG